MAWSGWIPIAIGIVLLTGAIVDPRRYYTRLYDDNPDAISGYWGLSGSSRTFRVWIAVGACFFILVEIGVAIVG